MRIPFCSALAGVLLWSGSACAQATNPVNVAVDVYGADAVFKVNGVPQSYIRHPGQKGNASPESVSGTGYALLCRNGENKIELEATVTDPKGYVAMSAYKDPEQPLYQQKLSKSGTLAYTLNANDFPEWSWTKADAVADGKAELLQAVAEYQQAFVKKDEARIEAFEKPLIDDVVRTGMIKPEMLKELSKQRAAELRTLKLRPIPAAADLTVQVYMDGKLYMVTGKDHQAPVRQQLEGDPGMTNDHGQYWSRIGGKWYVVVQ